LSGSGPQIPKSLLFEGSFARFSPENPMSLIKKRPRHGEQKPIHGFKPQKSETGRFAPFQGTVFFRKRDSSQF
jgi:hypothetical protein